MGQENVDDCFYLIEWDPIISAIFSTADRYIDGQLKGTLSVRKSIIKIKRATIAFSLLLQISLGWFSKNRLDI